MQVQGSKSECLQRKGIQPKLKIQPLIMLVTFYFLTCGKSFLPSFHMWYCRVKEEILGAKIHWVKPENNRTKLLCSFQKAHSKKCISLSTWENLGLLAIHLCLIAGKYTAIRSLIKLLNYNLINYSYIYIPPTFFLS